MTCRSLSLGQYNADYLNADEECRFNLFTHYPNTINNMDAPLIVASPSIRLPNEHIPPPLGSNVNELLRQMVELQREQLSVMKSQNSAAQEGQNRMRAFLSRWQTEFPDIGASCRRVIPLIERAYLHLIQEMTERVSDEDDGLSNDFLLGEFLDRYGTRLSQLGNILSQLGPMADAAPVTPVDKPAG